MNTTPSQRLGFLHHIRLVPLFACILGGILVLFALSSALAGYFLWQADRDQRDVTAEIEIRTGLANSSDFLRSARINMIQAGAASRIAEMEAMKRNIAQAESEIKQSQQGYRAYQNRPVKTPADEALDTELNQRFLNRPDFPGECFICELRLPDHCFRWKHNKLFLLLPEEYGPAFPAIVDCYTSPPT